MKLEVFKANGKLFVSKVEGVARAKAYEAARKVWRNSNVLVGVEQFKGKHLYSVEVGVIFAGYVEVEANNRAQAASLVKRAGYEVRSVNMIG